MTRTGTGGLPRSIGSASSRGSGSSCVTRFCLSAPITGASFGEAFDVSSLRSLDDLARLPFTSKDSIAPTQEEPQKAREIVLQPTPELIRKHWPLGRKLLLLRDRWLHGEAAMRERLASEYRPVSVFFTTGRTALPTAFVLSKVDLRILEEVGRRIIHVARIDTGEDRIISLFPYAPHLAFWQVYYAGVGGSVFTLNTGGGKVMGTDAILQAIEKIRPAYLVGIPGLHLSRVAGSSRRRPESRFRQGARPRGTRSRPATGRVSRSCSKRWGLGSRGCRASLVSPRPGSAGPSVRVEAESGFHTYPDMEIVEIVDPESGKPVGAGQTGELVYTSLTGRGVCVIRYPTGGPRSRGRHDFRALFVLRTQRSAVGVAARARLEPQELPALEAQGHAGQPECHQGRT